MEWLPTPEAEATENSSAKRKRAREEDTVQTIVTDKKGCDEPMSWWTCLMLGITDRQSRVVKKNLVPTF